MKRGKFTVLQNKELAPATFRMVLAGDTEAITAPGQFVNIALTGKFLRRPISVCDWNEAQLTLIYKVVGQGTAQMSQMVPGTELDLLTGLGNGYDLEKSGDKPLLIGGGVGIPPLYALAKAHCTGQIASGYFGVQPERGTIFDCGVPGIGDCSLFDHGGWFPGDQRLCHRCHAPDRIYLSVYLWACAHASGHRRKGCDLGTIQL